MQKSNERPHRKHANWQKINEEIKRLFERRTSLVCKIFFFTDSVKLLPSPPPPSFFSVSSSSSTLIPFCFFDFISFLFLLPLLF